MMRVLVIQLRRLGDLLMVTPLLRQLDRAFPAARIDLLCESSGLPVLRHNPHLGEIITLPAHATWIDLLDMARLLRGRGYDWVIDAQGLPKTALLTRLSGAAVRVGFGGRWWRRPAYSHHYTRRNADYSARDKLLLLGRALDAAAAPDLRDLQLDFPVADEARRQAESFCRTHFAGEALLPPARAGGPRRWPVAALFGVSRQPYKIWPPERLAEIGRRLAGRGLQPFLVHGPGEEEAARRVAGHLDGALVDYPLPDLPTLKEILARCALFVGNDGGPKHMAACSGVPTLAVFGRVHPECWTTPDDPTQRWVATASASRGIPTRGPCEAVSALAELPVEAVWREAEALLLGQAHLFHRSRQPGGRL